ncbi:uncharacterized protein METZ01_LOCUS75029 [marine metagenome]|uniref:Periplasmic chaperone PpiD n=1 Tax=marine metagenome TaxID=408172 RepID=A0A381U1T1_9ZZZZ
MLQGFREGAGRWIAIAVLGLIAISFIFWGIDFTTLGTTFAAKVNGREISLIDFEREVQNQQNQYQELYRTELTDELRRELRRDVLERLIRQQALLDRIRTSGYQISDDRLTAFIRTIPVFQVGGEFSIDLYRSQLLNQGLSPDGFESLQREQLELLELQQGILNSSFYMPNEFRRYLEVFNQRREIAYALFEVDTLSEGVLVGEADIEAHYALNEDLYLSEESVDLQYIEVLGSAIAEGVEYSTEILEAYYEEEKYRFQTEEQRKARHILFANGDDAELEIRAQAALVRIEAGEDFLELADEFSDDVGTNNQGGDLGWLGEGALEGPFEDTLFAMEVGDIQGPIKTDFGYHIIRLDDIVLGNVQPFEAAKEELAVDYQNREAEELFYGLATELADLSFAAFDELETVSTQMDLPLKEISNFKRSENASVFPFNEAVLQAAFSREVLEFGENSVLVELDDNHVLILRVNAHYPSAQQPYEEVRAEIAEELARIQAEAEAFERVTSLTILLREGGEGQAFTEEQNGSWREAVWVERTTTEIPTEILAASFRLEKPRGARIFEHVAMANGDQALLVLSAVEVGQPESVPREQRDQRLAQVAQQTGMYEFSGYAGELRETATVRIPEEIFDPAFYSPLGGF